MVRSIYRKKLRSFSLGISNLLAGYLSVIYARIRRCIYRCTCTCKVHVDVLKCALSASGVSRFVALLTLYIDIGVATTIRDEKLALHSHSIKHDF